MAKTIKFNLILDEKPVRTIESLRDNFCIDEVLKFYQKGLLQKWLKVRGYKDYLEKVEAMSENQSHIIQLIEIFDIEKSEKEIKEALYILKFWEERKKKLQQWHKKDYRVKEIIANYHHGYEDLKTKILENKDDMPYMKIVAKEIYDKYYEIFKIDYKNFFSYFIKKVPLIIYAILMNVELRHLFLKDHQIKNDLSDYTLYNYNKAHRLLYSKFDAYNSDELLKSVAEINHNIKLNSFKGMTDGYWKDMEVHETKVMVLYIPYNTYIRNANKPKEEISAELVNGNFLILNGLLYKSNNPHDSLVYMEV